MKIGAIHKTKVGHNFQNAKSILPNAKPPLSNVYFLRTYVKLFLSNVKSILIHVKFIRASVNPQIIQVEPLSTHVIYSRIWLIPQFILTQLFRIYSAFY